MSPQMAIPCSVPWKAHGSASNFGTSLRNAGFRKPPHPRRVILNAFCPWSLFDDYVLRRLCPILAIVLYIELYIYILIRLVDSNLSLGRVKKRTGLVSGRTVTSSFRKKLKSQFWSVWIHWVFSPGKKGHLGVMLSWVSPTGFRRSAAFGPDFSSEAAVWPAKCRWKISGKRQLMVHFDSWILPTQCNTETHKLCLEDDIPIYHGHKYGFHMVIFGDNWCNHQNGGDSAKKHLRFL